MGQQKGGKKLRRCAKHKNMYAAQFHRTARNKAKAKERILRRQMEKPSPGRAKLRAMRPALPVTEAQPEIANAS